MEKQAEKQAEKHKTMYSEALVTFGCAAQEGGRAWGLLFFRVFEDATRRLAEADA
jgi:hypothetical protein